MSLSAQLSVFHSTLCSPLRPRSPLSAMPPTRRRRPAIRCLALDPQAPTPGPVPAPIPALVALLNDLFQEFMRTCIKRVRDQAATVSAVLAAEIRDNTDRPLKLRNPDLYYGHSNIECYYFCQQCKNYFEVTGLLGYKRILFIARFLKDHILNRWQQYKTRMQRNKLVPIT